MTALMRAVKVKDLFPFCESYRYLANLAMHSVSVSLSNKYPTIKEAECDIGQILVKSVGKRTPGYLSFPRPAEVPCSW